MEVEQLLEELRKRYALRLPFVAYRKPGEATGTAFLQQDQQVYHTGTFTEAGFVFAPFDLEKTAVLIPDDLSDKIIFQARPKKVLATLESGAISDVASDQKEKHVALVKKALVELKEKELQKVVISRKEELDLPHELDGVSLFEKLLQAYPAALAYIWYHPQVGLWLGASPEALLQTRGSSFSTMALAGTQVYHQGSPISWGAKEKEEQQLVTDEIVSGLKPLVGDLEISSTYSSRAGNLLHLRTDISGKILSADKGLLYELINSLHPTPAVCGLPRKKAKKFILEQEGYNREFYSGFLGEINLLKSRSRSRDRRNVENLAYRSLFPETALYVNLRCIRVLGNRVRLFVGGGITAASEPVAEWEETVNKARTMKKVLPQGS